MFKKAVILMIMSALAFALLNVFVKKLTHFNVYQIVFFRSIGSLFFTLPFLMHKKISILGNEKFLLLSRGFIGFVAMTLFFMSLKHLSMGASVSIRYISPIFAALFALILLKERVKHLQWFCFAIALSGVFILKGFNIEVNSYGIFYALLSAVFTGLVFIIIRKIGNKDHPIVVVNYFMIIAALFGGVLAISNWQNPVGIEWVILLSLGVFGYFGQYYMTKAFQIGEVNQIAPLKYIEVIFTMLIGVIWLAETYTIIGLLGISLILGGLILNFMVKRRSSFDKNSKTKMN
ncbi:DMT family transporter [Psychroserpens ponticola]|uniref:DMT family transporter n=1 Tax=Psychroserpens ponticola TaxID=2932268 RepID=A0ABY7RUV0_9FLAO|nr:DMT family transporter [Psychroserpens ponticola]WCO00882.1 DMT family transporter [Psychroserpens ponticola]